MISNAFRGDNCVSHVTHLKMADYSEQTVYLQVHFTWFRRYYRVKNLCMVFYIQNITPIIERFTSIELGMFRML